MTDEGAKGAKITVFIAGDSTACDYEPSRAPRAGWGQMIGRFFDQNRVAIVNRAISGRSSLSFINEGALDGILADIKSGDYLLIQFGHNDAKKEDPTRYADPDTYQTYLSQYVNGARQAGANPVLITPVNRRSFEKGRLVPTHGLYPGAMITLAKEENVPLVDLTEQSRVLFEALGEEKTKELFLWLKPGESVNYPEGVQDDTHFAEKGAVEIAKLIVQGIKELNLPLAKYIREF
ncbi:MAG: rhamnogalacturonan acetylesterase [Bacteroidota bacterium]